MGQHQLMRLSWKLPSSSMPWSWLQREKDWAFCWRSRERSDLWMGLGACLLWSDPLAFGHEAPCGVHIFGGRPFEWDPSGKVSAMWGELQGPQWILPRLLFCQKSDGLHVWLYARKDEASDREAQRAQLLREAEEIQRSLLDVTSETPLSRLPAYLIRRDQPGRDEWVEQVKLAIAAMQHDDLSKVVLSRSISLEFKAAVDGVNLLRQLLGVSEEAFVFALKTPSGRMFLGRSPERVLAWDRQSFAIDAIAGTRRRSASKADDRSEGHDLQNSVKDQHEHRLVTDTIADQLRAAGLQFSAVEAEEILRLQHVQHMRTRFQGLWSGGARGFELLENLHPTPAVGGVPRGKALRFLADHESFERGWFAGYIGLLGEERGEFAIGIRSALIRETFIHIFAGAGIVAASDPQSEWRETELKMQNFLGLLSPTQAMPRQDRSSESYSL